MFNLCVKRVVDTRGPAITQHGNTVENVSTLWIILFWLRSPEEDVGKLVAGCSAEYSQCLRLTHKLLSNDKTPTVLVCTSALHGENILVLGHDIVHLK